MSRKRKFSDLNRLKAYVTQTSSLSNASSASTSAESTLLSKKEVTGKPADILKKKRSGSKLQKVTIEDEQEEEVNINSHATESLFPRVCSKNSFKKLNKLKKSESDKERLKGARFRMLNEQLYTNSGSEMKKFFEENRSEFEHYHSGFRQQVGKWPLNPLDVIIKDIQSRNDDIVVADFGCGVARLAQSVSQKVFSFDLVAVNSHVTACDIAKVPLKKESVDIVVFCLSLMGINFADYLVEGCRVLRTEGTLWIAEIRSRFENMTKFLRNLEKYLGLVKISQDLTNSHFVLFSFRKDEPKGSDGGSNDTKDKRNSLKKLVLSPCLYKKR